jgi:microcystin-dependent protein
MATQTSVEQPIILYSTDTIGPIGPRGPSAVSNTPGNLATLGNDFLILVPGPVSGNASPFQVVKGNDTRLSDARVPLPHAATHKSGGTDAIKLDELAAPTDIVTLNASTSAHGLLKKLDNNANHVMNGQGNWVTPAGGGDMAKSDYDVNGDLIVDHAHLADSVSWSGITGAPTRFFPAGVVLPFAGITANVPSGFILCDGSSYPTATYPALFAAIQYSHGGSGANFNVPDMRGYTPVGAGAVATGLTNRAVGTKFGEEKHTLVTAELAAHNHIATQADHTHTLVNNGAHAHNATMPDHQHGLQPFAHTHLDNNGSGHTHGYIYAFGPGGGSGSNAVPVPYKATNVQTDATAISISTYTSPILPTYLSSQWGGQPGFATAAANVPATNTVTASSGAVPAINVQNNGSGTGHNNIQPSLYLNYIISL